MYDIFSPCVFICFLLGHVINCSTFTGGVLGENILSLCVKVSPLCLCFPPFLPRQLLGYELEEKRYNILPPGPVFPTCDRKTCKKLMGERKMVFLSHFHIFPPWTMLYLVPFSESYGIEVHENDDFYPWLTCTFFCV
jgi:hypothetical protein